MKTVKRVKRQVNKPVTDVTRINTVVVRDMIRYLTRQHGGIRTAARKWQMCHEPIFRILQGRMSLSATYARRIARNEPEREAEMRVLHLSGARAAGWEV